MSPVVHSSQVKDWSRVVWTGSRYLDVLDPDPEDILIGEVAHGLSHEMRFKAAATAQPWSVLRHSLLCLALAEEDGFSGSTGPGERLLRTILLHDGPEYVLGDLLAPIKHWCPGYKDIEEELWRAFVQRFDLWPTLGSAERHYDLLALSTEKAYLISEDCGGWPALPEPREIPWDLAHASHHEITDLFLRECERLKVV